ncbi:branched-chain amino acid transport system permease protein [Paenibacillus phyllosphaerae]|uniref:Branched-chain amino acid transport system permease protein n=1 Tax=Paenibacillus phyllosphaerae TaxID=274593 RepID=A0A7W5B3L7_9BACL|nr:branched-chain amino acid ABC transporter permease [Paenibacillus phyllosphaerae]MBB3113805.1 branched-chain amino acid transport system permease protein [Paenibacillus phyllosphaerae]
MSLVLQLMISGLAVGCLYALIALGYSLTYVVNGTLNMSQGQLVMLGGVIMFGFTSHAHLPFLVSFALAAALVALLNLGIERLAIRKFDRGPNAIEWVLSTIAVGIIIQDVALYFNGPDEGVTPSPVGDGMLRIMGAGVYWKEFVFLPVVALLLVGLIVFYKKSHWGLWLRATADNRTAIEIMGVSSNKIVAVAYVLSGLLAGLGGALMSTNYAVSVDIGLALGLKAISVAILAGVNNPKGIVAAGLILGIAEVFIGQYISTAFREMFVYGMVILVLYWKPAGLFNTSKTVIKV